MKINSSSQFQENEKEKRRRLSEPAPKPEPEPELELKQDNLLKICKTIECPYHRQQFRAVCRLWRYSVPNNNNNNNNGGRILSSKFPFQIPSKVDGIFEMLVATTTFVVRPTKGEFKDVASLLMVEEINPGLLTIRRPLSKTLLHSSGSLNLLDTRVSVLAQGYKIRFLEKGKGACERVLKEEFLHNAKKILLFNQNDPSTAHDLWSIMLDQSGKLWDVSLNEWHYFELYDPVIKCYDIVKFEDESTLFGIDEIGRLFFIDYIDRKSERWYKHNIVKEGVDESGEKRLVVKKASSSSSSDEEIYMVVRNTGNANFSFSVYKMDGERKVWEKVQSLGNQTMFFVGHDVSFSASLQDFQGLQGSCEHRSPENCIFFSKGSFPVCTYAFLNDSDGFLFDAEIEGTELYIGQYFLGDEFATGLTEPTYKRMFTPAIESADELIWSVCKDPECG